MGLSTTTNASVDNAWCQWLLLTFGPIACKSTMATRAASLPCTVWYDLDHHRVRKGKHELALSYLVQACNVKKLGMVKCLRESYYGYIVFDARLQ